MCKDRHAYSKVVYSRQTQFGQETCREPNCYHLNDGFVGQDRSIITVRSQLVLESLMSISMWPCQVHQYLDWTSDRVII